MADGQKYRGRLTFDATRKQPYHWTVEGPRAYRKCTYCHKDYDVGRCRSGYGHSSYDDVVEDGIIDSGKNSTKFMAKHDMLSSVKSLKRKDAKEAKAAAKKAKLEAMEKKEFIYEF